MDPFTLALKRLSKAQMKATAKAYEKTVPKNRAETKEDFALFLDGVLSDKQKKDALSTFMLAGRQSMHLFRLPELEGPVNLPVDFHAATAKPQPVYCGALGEYAEGQQLILWTMLDGSCTYLDASLAIRTTAEAVVYASFYDPTVRILQVRAGQSAAEKIKVAFAKLVEIEVSKGVMRLAIKSRAEMYDFGKLLEARVTKCKGRRKQPKGFDVVSGENEDGNDLRGLPDYNDHVAATDPIQEDLTFTINKHEYKLGVAFEAESVVFKNGAPEEVVQFVYGCLKQHFKLDGQDNAVAA